MFGLIKGMCAAGEQNASSRFSVGLDNARSIARPFLCRYVGGIERVYPLINQ
jgi:hypothetical protein